MSQNTRQKQNTRNAQTVPFLPKTDDPMDDVSPDDPIGVEPKPGNGNSPSTGPMK